MFTILWSKERWQCARVMNRHGAMIIEKCPINVTKIVTKLISVLLRQQGRVMSEYLWMRAYSWRTYFSKLPRGIMPDDTGRLLLEQYRT